MVEESKMHQVLVRLPRELFDDLLKQSAIATLERNERVTVQAVIRQAVCEFLAQKRGAAKP